MGPPIASRVLTTTTLGLARAAMASGRAPNRYASAPSPPGTADAPMTTRSAFSASRRIALRTLGASRSAASPRPRRCCLMNAASARSAWARTAIVIPGGTRWRTTTVASWCWAIASANRTASSACGPPRTGTRTRLISREPRCLTTAMSHGDSRTTSSIVGEKTVGPCARPSWPAGALPPQPKMMRSASCSADASMIPSAACRPMRTIGWMARALGGVVEHLLEETAGVPGAGRALATAASPRGPRRCRAPRARPAADRASRHRAGSAPRPCPGWRPG